MKEDERPDNDGWIYNEETGEYTRRPKVPKVFDWTAKDGEIACRRLDDPDAKTAHSLLSYFRPLRPGEALRYEFFHKPGEVEIHPALGRVVFLLGPDGVRLRWLTELAEDGLELSGPGEG